MKKLKLTNIAVTLLISVIIFAFLISLYTLGADNEATKTGKAASGDDVYNALLLGKDNAAGLCDVIVLTSIDFSKGEISIMQIPRDTYFDYGNGEHNKINGAPHVLGVSGFADKLGKAMGIDVGYYLALDVDTLKEMVDMLSGVEIDIPKDMDYDDPAQNLSIHLKAGKNVLNGEQALGFIRYRSGYATGDIGRLDAQKMFLNAFFKAVGKQKNPILYYNLFSLLSKKGETNIKESDLVSMGARLIGRKDMSVSYMTAPGEAVQSDRSGAWYYVLSSSSMTELTGARFGSKKDFDIDNKFVDKQVKSFYDIYKKRCECKIYSAQDIDNNQININ